MPPHCDTMDGPVVRAAKRALEAGNVNLVLPWIPQVAEEELTRAFEKTMKVRKSGGVATEVANFWFFETAVRLHRQGEGAPYTGLKPAGLDPGPVVPRAERSLEIGDPGEVVAFLLREVENQLRTRFDLAMARRDYGEDDVGAARAYVQSMLGFLLFSHHLHEFLEGKEAHAVEGGHSH